MQLDLFGLSEPEQQREPSAPLLTSSGAWTSPELVAFNAALVRGSLADAVGVLNKLKLEQLNQVLLASGFSLAYAKTREGLIAAMQWDIMAAARLKLTGHQLRISRENSIAEIHGGGAVDIGNVKQRVTSEIAGQMQRGMRVVDGAGKAYEAFSATFDYLEVHPIGEDGKPQVFAGNALRFDLTDAAGGSAPPNLYPPRRFEPVYLVDPLGLARPEQQSDNELTNVDNQNGRANGRIIQSQAVLDRAGNQGRDVGGDSHIDSKSLDAGLADASQVADSGESVLEGAGDANGQGERDSVGGGEPSASDSPRNSSTARGQGGTTGAGNLNPVSSETNPSENYVFTDEDRIGLGSLGEKFNDNLQAIKVVRELQAENRNATSDERRMLARYVGWGGLKGVFDPENKQWKRQHVALRSLLNDVEWAAASRSQLDAFYTAPIVGKSMYAAASRLGFDQGRILEPAVGVGNFFGMMPITMRNASTLHGVELDVLSSQIVASLYPRAKISQATGFQDYKVPAGYFDMVIGNPPFGGQAIADESGSAYSGWSIHNYFFAKSIELLRPGGIMPMVVTHAFLDKLDPHVRQWIARRAELVSAVRLPNTTFKENANTEVVTDILLLRRLDNDNELGQAELPDWLNTTDVALTNPNNDETATVSINNYFLNHPENVLGVNAVTGSMYRGNEYTVEPNGDLEDQLAQWVSSLPQGLYVPLERKAEDLKTDAIAIPEMIKEGSFFIRDETVWVRMPDQFGEQRALKWEPPNQRAIDRMTGMIQIRDALRYQMKLERSVDSSSETVEEGRANLNKLYDDFRAKHGFLNDPVNRRIFLDDTESPLLQALEFDYEKPVTAASAEELGIEQRPARAVKADIFSGRVLFPPVDVQVVETAKDALLHSLNNFGRVNIEYMMEVYGQDQTTILAELDDLLFTDPVKGIVTADEYLSGDVKTKYSEASKAAEHDISFRRNIEALKKVVPADKLPSEIHASLGANWIPPDIFSEFSNELVGADVTYHYVTAAARWLESRKTAADFVKNNSEFGIDQMSGLDILVHLMNSRGLEIKRLAKVEGRDTYVTDEPATEAVRQRADKIRAKWDSWLWSDGDRSERLATLYNEKFNRTVERRYDGSHLTFPGMSPLITLLDHQKNGVWRGLQDRVILLDQVVGAGKTYEMIAMIMEMRRLGITKKPILNVPNHLTLQWRSDFYRLYPGANVLAATPQDFEKEGRQKFFSKIVTGNWDAVIVGHSSMKKIEVPIEAEIEIVEEQFNDITDSIEDLKRGRGDRNIVRDMEKIKATLESKLVRMREKSGKKDKVVDFGDLGVDAICTDEIHIFKNLFFTTQMNRVSGLGNPAGSGHAFDLFVKFRWLQKTFGEKAPLITATGTPVSNSLAEMFTMQRYMQYDKLKRDGLHVFDAWAKLYGDVQNVYEVAPSGTGYRLSQRFAKFKNLSSLMASYRTFADVVTLDDLKAQEKALGKTFPVPKLAGGRPLNVIAQRSELQVKFFGVPEIAKTEEGAIKFELNLSLPTEITQRDDGKFIVRQTTENDFAMLSHPHDTREETAYAAAMAAITPVMTIDPQSIVGQFENLRELTRRSKGKINALSLTSLANKAGLDYRLINPHAPDFEDSKINQAVRKMLAIAQKWESDKGVQLVFCDLSVPLSAKAKMASKEKRIYVRDAEAKVIHKRGTLHTVKDYEGMPYFLVAAGKGTAKTFTIFDPVSGQLMKDGFDSKQEAHKFVAQFLERENGQERWLDLRESSLAISAEEIDEYKNEQGIENDAESADLEITAHDIEGSTGVGGFSVYDDIKAKLVAGGIPATQIEFIHDHDTPQAKDVLFKRTNRGEVRFLFGSTPKMGAGTNVQKRLVGLHHIDAPWRPSDLEQREGRIIRRGNELYERDPDGFEVDVIRYATSQTYDTRRWQLLEHKAAGLEQLRNYNGANEIDDVASEAANSADMKAAASGNPLILKETQLSNEVKKLRLLERAHRDNEFMLHSRLTSLRRFINDSGPHSLKEYQNAIEARDSASALGHYKGKALNDRDDIVAALKRVVADTCLKDSKAVLTYRGVPFTFTQRDDAGAFYMDVLRDQIYIDQFSPSGVTTRMENWVNSIDGKIAHVQLRLRDSHEAATSVAATVGKSFAQHEELMTAIEDHGIVQRALMKSNASAAVKPEARQEFDQAVSRQKALLRSFGFGAAVDEIDSETNDPDLSNTENRLDAQDRAPALASLRPGSEVPLWNRDTIAGRYASMLAELREGVSAEPRPFHYELADAILDKKPYGLKFLANGMNDVAKTVFSAVTGIALPKQQGATWAAIREWSGLSELEDNRNEAHRRLQVERKSLEPKVGPDPIEWADKNVEGGCNAIKKIGTQSWLVNDAGEGFNLSVRGSHLTMLIPYLKAKIEYDALNSELAASKAETALLSLGDTKAIVTDGIFSGQVLSIDAGVVTQKVGRDGNVVLHRAGVLSMPVEIGQVIDIRYLDGKGIVASTTAKEVSI